MPPKLLAILMADTIKKKIWLPTKVQLNIQLQDTKFWFGLLRAVSKNRHPFLILPIR